MVKKAVKRGRIRIPWVVMSPRSTKVHVAYGLIEGDRTVCGRRMQIGWTYARVPRRAARKHKCSQCFTGGRARK